MSITPTMLAEKAAISVPFASQILNGDRKPSLATALRIYDATGAQFGLLAGLSPDTIEDLRKQAA